MRIFGLLLHDAFWRHSALFLSRCKLQQSADIERPVWSQAPSLLELSRLYFHGVDAAVLLLFPIATGEGSFHFVCGWPRLERVQKVRVALAPFQKPQVF
jgi:hypothetical protein